MAKPFEGYRQMRPKLLTTILNTIDSNRSMQSSKINHVMCTSDNRCQNGQTISQQNEKKKNKRNEERTRPKNHRKSNKK